MTSVNDFLMENVDTKPETREVKFKRFKSPFVIKSLTEDENSVIQKDATRKIKDKQTRQVISQLDQSKYIDLMVLNSVVTPDLNSEQIQKSWNCLANPVGVLKKMLRAGEYIELMQQVQDLSGFDMEDVEELKDEVKN
ncbi:phage tail assembly chaperone [Companilactobacillus sp. HBUAS59699]|uniref:phage tail assembly chaperone n=1 Tax=Companilactobacillus sp. HBUAS59699 TaxID=3109358 RepID=UPI002FF1B0D6